MTVSDIIKSKLAKDAEGAEAKENKKLSPDLEERKKRALAAAQAERDWGRSRRSSRLRGHGRGTGTFDRSMVQR